MRSLIVINRERILEAAEQIISDCAKLKSRLGIELLFGRMRGEVTETGLSTEEVARIQAAIMWIAAVAPDLAHEDTRGAKALEFAAETFEYLMLLGQDTIAVDAIPLNLYSAILYASECKFPNAEVVSTIKNGASRRQLREVKSLTDMLANLVYCVGLLAAANFRDLNRATTVSDAGRSTIQRLLDTNSDSYRKITSLILIYEALRLFSLSALTGEGSQLTRSKEMLEKASAIVRTNPFLAEIYRYISLLFESITPQLTRRSLEPFVELLGTEYQSLLIQGRRPVFTLWPSQTYALQQDFLLADHIGISMPPSAGKTLLAEMKIVSELHRKPDALVFYVVPLNALARQIQKDLQERLRLTPLRYNVKVLTGTYEIEDQDLALTREENVIITTPEKLDGLIRNIDQPSIRRYFERCCLFIFDECHSMDNGRRGITYELLIARIRKMFPQAKTLGISAVFSNMGDFVQWIGHGQGTCRSILHSWRPTGSHYATWEDTGKFIYESTWSTTEYGRSGDRKADAAKLAVDLQQAHKQVLILAERRDSCRKYAEALVRAVQELDRPILTPEEQKDLKNLANLVRREITTDSRLADFIEFGVAYHHGHLPKDVRASIEDYIANETLKFIVSTTTLSEGVNFPIRCVILPNIWVGRGTPLRPIKLKNIIGRAGRAHISTSGLAVVFKGVQRVKVKDARYDFDTYCFDPPPELLRVESGIKELLEEGASFDQINTQQGLDSQILAYLAMPGMQAENQADQIVETAFLAAESPELKAKAVDLVNNRMQQMAAVPDPLLIAGSPYRITKLGEHALRSGFGLRDAALLTRLLKQIGKSDPDYFCRMGTGDRLDEVKIKQLMRLTFTTLESQIESYGFTACCTKVLGQPPSRVKQDMSDFLNEYESNEDIRSEIDKYILSLDVELIWEWINGATAKDLGQFLLQTHPPFERSTHELATIEASYTIENLPYSISWPMYAIRLILDFLLEEEIFNKPVSPQFDNLPYYMRYGVAHPMAIAVMEKARDKDFRQDSMKIATGYDVETSFPANRESLFKQLLALEEDQISRKIGDRERANVLWTRLAEP